MLNELGVEASSVGSGTSCPGLKYTCDYFGGGGGGGSGVDGGEAVPGLIFNMMGGEESLTGSAFNIIEDICFAFRAFLLGFSQHQLRLFIFPHSFFSVFVTIFFSILLTLGSTSPSATTMEEVLAWGSGEDSATLFE